ncbi:unnamed protein product [marine sediment metagenome]|uniref:Uncharacterized protein n=1 Tax=marine sediment metagenome TaxID=412755 RepID=X0ZYH3_9ZZZZ
MKKIKKSKSKDYPVLRLYKDDLEKIETIFKENYEDYEIIIDEYRLENISDISKIKKRETTNFSIKAHFPYIHLDISKDSASLHISDEDDLKLLGMFSKIDEILSKRISLLSVFTIPWIYFSVQLILWIIFWGFPIERFNIPKLLFMGSFLILIVIWVLGSFWLKFKKHSLIYLSEDSHSKLNFFQRNKDKIIISIISAIIGAIIGIGGTIVANWLYNKLF